MATNSSLVETLHCSCFVQSRFELHIANGFSFYDFVVEPVASLL